MLPLTIGLIEDQSNMAGGRVYPRVVEPLHNERLVLHETIPVRTRTNTDSQIFFIRSYRCVFPTERVSIR